MTIFLPQEEAAGYLHTLIIALANMPANTHPVHYERLRNIKGQIEASLARQLREVEYATTVSPAKPK